MARNHGIGRFVGWLVPLVCAAALVACGGGGGNPGVNTAAASGVPLFTTAPSAVTIGTSGSTPYTIGGGAAPYTATSSNTSIVTTSLSGTTMTLKGVGAGTAQVVVRDATSGQVSIAVTVGAAALSVSPSGATGNVGDVLNFQISGGAPGYAVTVNNTSIATVSEAPAAGTGTAFKLTLVNVGSTNVLVTDASGNTTSFVLTANQTSALLRLSPSALLIGENNLDPITLFVYGGTGPYTAFTSDTIKSSIVSSGTLAKPALTLSVGSSGNRCINPVDAAGKYIVSGTYAVTLTVVDSQGASATSILTIQDNGAGLGAGCP